MGRMSAIKAGRAVGRLMEQVGGTRHPAAALVETRKRSISRWEERWEEDGSYSGVLAHLLLMNVAGAVLLGLPCQEHREAAVGPAGVVGLLGAGRGVAGGGAPTVRLVVIRANSWLECCSCGWILDTWAVYSSAICMFCAVFLYHHLTL
jgi:hypothetical protein